MTSHDTALEAARSAIRAAAFRDPMADISSLAEVVLSAYISTLSPDVSGLVERLRTKAETCRADEVDATWVEDLSEAADALASLSLQLAAVEKKPLNLGVTKEWFEKQAAKEGDLEIGAGSRKLTSTINLTPEEMNEFERLAHEALPQWAQDKIASLTAAQEENERLRTALEKIERWFGEFPPTGDYWPSGGEMSYAACYGSNGERDFMRGVARDALSTPSKGKDKTDAE